MCAISASRASEIASWQAIGFGAFLLIAETFRNWGAWPAWTSFAFDYLFAVLLLGLGIVANRGGRNWPIKLLVPLWLLVVSLFSLSFASHVSNLDQQTYGAIPHLPLTVGIGVMAGVALASLVTCVFAIHRAAKTRGSE